MFDVFEICLLLSSADPQNCISLSTILSPHFSYFLPPSSSPYVKPCHLTKRLELALLLQHLSLQPLIYLVILEN